MSYTCSCLTNNKSSVLDDCSKCQEFCESNNYQCTDNNNTFSGVPYITFVVLVVIQIALLVFMIAFSIVVIKKCKGKPSWLNPTIITLLILWLLIGWFPGIGLALFIALLIILIVFNNKCKKMVKK